ncbi:MAG: hypothetical protein JSS60_04610 [Verrucomicrobia bacterium]|nr:hypothetical protein [Verrucomicrobiota bacterium]
MTSATTVVTQQTQTSSSIRAERGYIDTVSLRSGEYKVYAYVLAPDGSKIYLPDNCDRQVREKLRTLSWGLLNAHDKKSQSLGETSLEIKGIDSSGLIKSDNAVISHDFTIQPIDQNIAEQMARTLTLSGQSIQASAIKAQDVWNAFEEVVRTSISASPISNPARIDTTTTPSSTTTSTHPSTSQPPAPHTTQTSPPTPPTTSNPTHTPTPIPPSLTPIPTPLSTLPPTSIDLDLRGVDLQQPNWYETLPLRLKYRIVSEVEQGRSPLGGVYFKVWQHFETKVREILLRNPSSKVTLLTLLESEKNRLARECGRLNPASSIPRSIRQQAEKVYDAYMKRRSDSQVTDDINALMCKEFDRKEELFQRIRQQAEAERIVIAAWDRDWAKNHFADDPRRFVQALARWLDNDGN